MIQRHKARPDQAGFMRRFTAFMVDNLIIMLISVIVFFAYSEITAARRGEKGEFSQMLSALKKGEAVVIGQDKLHGGRRPGTEGPSHRRRKVQYHLRIHHRLHLLHPVLPLRRPHPWQAAAAPAGGRPARQGAPGLVPVAGARPRLRGLRPAGLPGIFAGALGPRGSDHARQAGRHYRHPLEKIMPAASTRIVPHSRAICGFISSSASPTPTRRPNRTNAPSGSIWPGRNPGWRHGAGP